jgi:two-component system, LuxR family, response regulator FixJ
MTNDAVVFVVDEDAGVRDAVAEAVRSRGGKAEVFASTGEFLRSFRDRPGCLVVDASMLDAEQGHLAGELRRADRGLPIVALLAGPDTATTVAAMRGGAITVLDKPVDPAGLQEAIASALVLEEETRARREDRRRMRLRFDALSDKERDVLHMIVAGRPNKAMANALGASLRTVENRRREVFSKLGVRSVAELVALAIKAEQEAEEGGNF